MGYYSTEELKKIGFKYVGENVLISYKTSIYSPETISIGDNVRIDDFTILSGKINIGSHVHIAPFCGLYGRYGIELKDFVGLSSRVSVYSATDDYSGTSLTNPTIPDEYRSVESGRVIIKKHTLIGASSVILPNVIIGEGVSIGSMSLINKSTKDWRVYFGIPARPINNRKKDLLELEKKFRADRESGL